MRIFVPAAGITRDSLAAKLDKTTGKVVLYPLDEFRRVVEINFIAPIYWALEMLGRIAEERHDRGTETLAKPSTSRARWSSRLGFLAGNRVRLPMRPPRPVGGAAARS